MSKTKIIFISNLIATLIILVTAFVAYLIYRNFSYQDIFRILPLILGIFNIIVGIIIKKYHHNMELANSFILLGLVGVLIGGASFCGLLNIG